MDKAQAWSLLKRFGKYVAPRLSTLLRIRRPLAIDWKCDTAPRPPHIPLTADMLGMSPGLGDSDNGDYALKGVKMDRRRPFRILCLDGGGVRGVLNLGILKRIVEHDPNFMEEVDLIAGTSAGGILSLLLATAYTPAECDDIYMFAAPHIFGHQPWRVINPWRAKYSDKNKQEIFQHYFGDRTMIDLKKTALVVAFRLDGRKSKTHSFFNKEGWRPAVFSNMPKGVGHIEPDTDLPVWDAAMRTSAAPTFFPVFRGYTDGGIVANNPSIIASAKAMSHFPNVSANNITVLSLGAGSFPRHTNVFSAGKGQFLKDQTGKDQELYRADWGIKQWIPFLLDLLLDGDTVTTEMVMHYLLGSTGLYHRCDPLLPRMVLLDDVNAMKDLQEFAKTVDLTETFRFVDDNFRYDPSASNEDTGSYNSIDSSSDYHSAWVTSKAQILQNGNGKKIA